MKIVDQTRKESPQVFQETVRSFSDEPANLTNVAWIGDEWEKLAGPTNRSRF